MLEQQQIPPDLQTATRFYRLLALPLQITHSLLCMCVCTPACVCVFVHIFILTILRRHMSALLYVHTLCWKLHEPAFSQLYCCNTELVCCAEGVFTP